MNTLFIFILISFLEKILNYEPPDSLYSLILDKVRKDIVKNAIINLPKRSNVDILQMLISMSNEKKENNLTDIESAFLIYMWIGENIEISCYKIYAEDESPTTVYKNGIGSVTGISSLFNTMCSHLNIKSGSIQGFTKMKSYTTTTRNIETRHMWNFILVNNTKYLIDSSLGAGFCIDYQFNKNYIPLYFGTKPEILIKTHFPKDEEFQLLEKNIKKYQWQNIVFRDRYFYLNGLKSINPDVTFFCLINIDKISIEYDSSNMDISFYGIMHYDNYRELVFNKVTYNKGKAEISLKNWNKIYSHPNKFELYIGKNKDSSIIFGPSSC